MNDCKGGSKNRETFLSNPSTFAMILIEIIPGKDSLFFLSVFSLSLPGIICLEKENEMRENMSGEQEILYTSHFILPIGQELFKIQNKK